MSTKRACSGACPSTKRLRAFDETLPLLLPVDLLLEIAARADVATIVRCAATSKHFRATILEQSFRRRLLDSRAAGFDPSSLRGISYKLMDRDKDDICRSHTLRLLQTPPPSSPSDPAISRSRAVSLCLEPVAWRDGLVILRHSQRGELTACNRNTGHEAPLHDSAALAVSDDYPHALLTVDDGGANFELLVADKDLRFQTYSSRHGKWGAIVHAAAAQHHHLLHHPPSSQTARTRDLSKQSVVINGRRGNTVYWLCGCRSLMDAKWLHIVALDVDTAGARATVIDLPRRCVSRMMGFKHNNGITLAVSADGRLSLVVSETQVISMWTSEGDPDQIRWSRRVVVDRQEWGVHNSIRFEGFGERSGTLLFYMSFVGLVQLNLATNKALVMLHRKRPCMNRISQWSRKRKGRSVLGRREPPPQPQSPAAAPAASSPSTRKGFKSKHRRGERKEGAQSSILDGGGGGSPFPSHDWIRNVAEAASVAVALASIGSGAVVSGALELDEVLSNIIVHIPDPATLVRAALVNKQWYEIAKTPKNLKEFCKRQPTRFVGFFGEYEGGWELVPMPLPGELSSVPRFLSVSFPPGLRNAKDCVYGHILLDLEGVLAVSNPFAKKFTLLPPAPAANGENSLGNFSLFKDGNPDVIVHVSVTMNQQTVNVHLLVYEDEVWTESDGFAMVEIPTQNDEPLCKPPLSVNGNVYILSVNGFVIEVRIVDCNVSIIELPGGSFEWGFQQMCRTEKFVFLYLHSDGFCLQIWSRSCGSWSKISSIDVPSMLDSQSNVKERFTSMQWDTSRSGWGEIITIFGVTDEAGIIALGMDGVDGIFMLDTEKQSVVRVGPKSSVASGDLIGNMMIPLVATWVPNLPNMSN